MEAALNAILVSLAFYTPSPNKPHQTTMNEGTGEVVNPPVQERHGPQPENEDLHEAKRLFDNLLEDKSNVDEIYTSDVIQRICNKLSTLKDSFF